MKNSCFFHRVVGYGWGFLALIGLQCTPDVPSKVDNDKIAVQVMTELRPQLTRTWHLRQVRVSPKMGNNWLGLKQDITFQDLATMTSTPATKLQTTPVDPRLSEHDGTIQYKGKTYPIQFNMWAGPGAYS